MVKPASKSNILEDPKKQVKNLLMNKTEDNPFADRQDAQTASVQVCFMDKRNSTTAYQTGDCYRTSHLYSR